MRPILAIFLAIIVIGVLFEYSQIILTSKLFQNLNILNAIPMWEETQLSSSNVSVTDVPKTPFSYPDPNPRQLLNITDFKWIKNNETVCSNSSTTLNTKKTLLIFAFSARENEKYRRVIRTTWGSQRRHNEWSIHLIFLLGEHDPTSEMTEEEVSRKDAALSEEHSKFGDLVIGNFIDSFHTLSYKHIMGFKWVLEFCQTANLVLKVDDYVFVDIPRILTKRDEGLMAKPEPNLYCHLRTGLPEREDGQKYRVTYEEFPHDQLPTFCKGAGYGITVELIHKLYTAHLSQKSFLWLDSVWVTGMLVEQVKKTQYKDPTVNHQHITVRLNSITYLDFCDKLDEWKGSEYGQLPFPEILGINRDSNFENNMHCLMNMSRLLPTL